MVYKNTDIAGQVYWGNIASEPRPESGLVKENKDYIVKGLPDGESMDHYDNAPDKDYLVNLDKTFGGKDSNGGK